jgi:hypothetical protein
MVMENTPGKRFLTRKPEYTIPRLGVSEAIPPRATRALTT